MLEQAIYRWRKTTDINRKYAVFELLLNERILLDAGYSDTGEYRIKFYDTITSCNFDWSTFRLLVEESLRLAEIDRQNDADA